MNETKSLYKIWRYQNGRSMKRRLTDEQVAYYKEKFPSWRWRKIQVENRSYQASLQANTGYGRYSSSREAWGKVCTELPHNRARLLDKTTNPVISYDDILDTMLAIGKGIR